MTVALLLSALLLQAPVPAPTTPPPAASAVAPEAPSLALLQARSDAEVLRVEVERLARRVAELEGLVAALSQPTLAALGAARKALEEDIARAGYVRDEQGRLSRRAEPETPPAPPGGDEP